jgi:hypothetical protein
MTTSDIHPFELHISVNHCSGFMCSGRGYPRGEWIKFNLVNESLVGYAVGRYSLSNCNKRWFNQEEYPWSHYCILTQSELDSAHSVPNSKLFIVDYHAKLLPDKAEDRDRVVEEDYNKIWKQGRQILYLCYFGKGERRREFGVSEIWHQVILRINAAPMQFVTK